jgi:hypothetical protein
MSYWKKAGKWVKKGGLWCKGTYCSCNEGPLQSCSVCNSGLLSWLQVQFGGFSDGSNGMPGGCVDYWQCSAFNAIWDIPFQSGTTTQCNWYLTPLPSPNLYVNNPGPFGAACIGPTWGGSDICYMGARLSYALSGGVCTVTWNIYLQTQTYCPPPPGHTYNPTCGMSAGWTTTFVWPSPYTPYDCTQKLLGSIPLVSFTQVPYGLVCGATSAPTCNVLALF